MSGYCWPTVYVAEPTLAQYWVTVLCLTPRWMWASVTDGGPTFTQLLFKASWVYYSQHIVGLLTPVEWILASTGDAGPEFTRHWVCVGLHCLTPQPSKHEALNQCWFYAGPASQTVGQNWVNDSCLLGVLPGHICVLHITGCEDIKTVAQLIEPKDDLVAVNHFPGSKSWHREVSGVVNLAGEDAVDIKKQAPPHQNTVSTCLLSREAI